MTVAMWCGGDNADCNDVSEIDCRGGEKRKKKLVASVWIHAVAFKPSDWDAKTLLLHHQNLRIQVRFRVLLLLLHFCVKMDTSSELPNIKRWIVFYPVYINSKKTIAEGRRISVAHACENPTCAEIADCCSHFKLPFAIEIDKAYPRDFMQRGRVRVLLKKDDGTLFNPSISSRKQLMLRVAEMVPKHHGRTTKKQETASTSTAGPSNKSGKGGKKRR
ncbi:hypothetical protein RJT34_32381 [Clitoria ternatea]|uniref:Signal recognition particle 19 kDa protein n=1 Tax=Clitoria ternatea TaxID=43366 RepID=A0AAN9EWV5_CLITE